MKKVLCIIGLFLVVVGVFRIGVSGVERNFLIKYEKVLYLLEDSPVFSVTNSTINSIYSACKWLSSAPLDSTDWNSYKRLVLGVRNGSLSTDVFNIASALLNFLSSSANAVLMMSSMVLFIVYFVVALFAYVCDIIVVVMMLIFA